MGLVNRVVPEGTGELREELRRNHCRQCAAHDRCGQDDRQRNPEGREQARYEVFAGDGKACFDSSDYIEGRKAFMEKRSLCSQAPDEGACLNQCSS